MGTQQSLTLHFATRFENRHVYIICTESNTRILHLNLTLEPTFPVEGDNSTFECTVDFTSHIIGGVFLWKHQGYRLKEGRRVHEIHWSEGLQLHSRLQIFKSKWTDSGEFANSILYLYTTAEAKMPNLLHTEHCQIPMLELHLSKLAYAFLDQLLSH